MPPKSPPRGEFGQNIFEKGIFLTCNPAFALADFWLLAAVSLGPAALPPVDLPLPPAIASAQIVHSGFGCYLRGLIVDWNGRDLIRVMSRRKLLIEETLFPMVESMVESCDCKMFDCR